MSKKMTLSDKIMIVGFSLIIGILFFCFFPSFIKMIEADTDAMWAFEGVLSILPAYSGIIIRFAAGLFAVFFTLWFLFTIGRE